MNKNIKIEYKIDKFKDYTGTEREFILAAVSVPLVEKEFIVTEKNVPFYTGDGLISRIYTFYNTTTKPVIQKEEHPVEKALLIGIAVRNAEDKFDEEIGKRIAVGKAMKFKGKQMFVSHAGLINTKVVKALLEQEAEYFKRDPQSYIVGYRNAERKWIEQQKLQQD